MRWPFLRKRLYSTRVHVTLRLSSSSSREFAPREIAGTFFFFLSDSRRGDCPVRTGCYPPEKGSSLVVLWFALPKYLCPVPKWSDRGTNSERYVVLGARRSPWRNIYYPLWSRSWWVPTRTRRWCRTWPPGRSWKASGGGPRSWVSRQVRVLVLRRANSTGVSM